MQRFHFKQDRDMYRVAHALARFALSSCETEVPPNAWVFEETRHGRPEISNRHHLSQLRFNISHTRQVVACIVTRAIDCGVDVELTQHCSDVNLLGRRVLAPSERAVLATIPEAERATLFCRYWTLKEAFAKALGSGMSLDFDGIAFDLGASTLRLQPRSNEWHFEQWSPTSTHILALAIRSSEPIRVIRHTGMPPPYFTESTTR